MLVRSVSLIAYLLPGAEPAPDPFQKKLWCKHLKDQIRSHDTAQRWPFTHVKHFVLPNDLPPSVISFAYGSELPAALPDGRDKAAFEALVNTT
eukprot:1391735-Pyramimonas_sp.AAC.1